MFIGFPSLNSVRMELAARMRTYAERLLESSTLLNENNADVGKLIPFEEIQRRHTEISALAVQYDLLEIMERRKPQ